MITSWVNASRLEQTVNAEQEKATVLNTVANSKQFNFNPKPIIQPTPKVVNRGEIERAIPVPVQVTDIQRINKINKFLKGKLKGKGDVFVKAWRDHGVDCYLMAAISIHETANGTSQVCRDYNNIAGINWHGDKNIKHVGRYRVFTNVDESILFLGGLLRTNYIDKGLTDIASIGNKFCPLDDVDNGKYGMDNSTWIPNVTKLYEQIKGA